jgi:hypothetical protein
MIAYIPYPSWIQPEIVSFLPIRWYGLMYLAAFLVTYHLFKYSSGREVCHRTKILFSICSSGPSSGFWSEPVPSRLQSMTPRGTTSIIHCRLSFLFPSWMEESA